MTCKERMERICTEVAEREGVTESLKAAEQMEWYEDVILSTTGQKRLF